MYRVHIMLGGACGLRVSSPVLRGFSLNRCWSRATLSGSTASSTNHPPQLRSLDLWRPSYSIGTIGVRLQVTAYRGQLSYMGRGSKQLWLEYSPSRAMTIGCCSIGPNNTCIEFPPTFLCLRLYRRNTYSTLVDY